MPMGIASAVGWVARVLVPEMQKIALLYNPASGTSRERRIARVESAAGVLRSEGHDVLTFPTESSDLISQQIDRLLRDEFTNFIVCGGDGTVHGVLQALVEAGDGVTLGIIPFGSGNLLAKDLGIPRHPQRAARALLTAQPVPTTVACMEYRTATGETARRYWIAAAGVGADAHVICKINYSFKARYGIYAYYAEAARQLLLARYKFPPFVVEFQEAGSNLQRREVVTQIVAERIEYFRRCLAVEKNGNSSGRISEDLHVVLFKTPDPMRYLNYGVRLLGNLAGMAPGRVRDVELVRVREISCRELRLDESLPDGWKGERQGSGEIFAEADGEFLGTLPVKIQILPATLSLLRPMRARQSS
jgi:diacylglycerol kinase family enzyme